MRPDVLKYIEDIDLSISRIEHHISGAESFEVFKNSWTIYDAVERRMAIIGEAVWQIDKLDKNFELTDKKKIIGLRHILTHDYDVVSADILWKVIKTNLPVLKAEIKTYLNNQ